MRAAVEGLNIVVEGGCEGTGEGEVEVRSGSDSVLQRRLCTLGWTVYIPVSVGGNNSSSSPAPPCTPPPPLVLRLCPL